MNIENTHFSSKPVWNSSNPFFFITSGRSSNPSRRWLFDMKEVNKTNKGMKFTRILIFYEISYNVYYFYCYFHYYTSFIYKGVTRLLIQGVISKSELYFLPSSWSKGHRNMMAMLYGCGKLAWKCINVKNEVDHCAYKFRGTYVNSLVSRISLFNRTSHNEKKKKL